MTKTTKTIPLSKKKVAELRSMAEALNLKGWENLERKELLNALKESKGHPEADREPVRESIGIKGDRVPVGSKAAIMKAKLDKQEKITIMIPLGAGEKTGASESVILNGYRLNIRKGMYVEVPEQVANVIKRSQELILSSDDFKRVEDGKPMKIEGIAPSELSR